VNKHIAEVLTPEAASEIKPEELEKDEQLLSVHQSIACDGCDMFPIVGIRYRCLAVHDTDLCEKCYAALVPQQKD